MKDLNSLYIEQSPASEEVNDKIIGAVSLLVFLDKWTDGSSVGLTVECCFKGCVPTEDILVKGLVPPRTHIYESV